MAGLHRSAHAFASAAINREMPDDLLFVQPWVYRWGLLFEYSITSYWAGDLRASLPAVYRKQTAENREFAIRRLREPPPDG